MTVDEIIETYKRYVMHDDHIGAVVWLRESDKFTNDVVKEYIKSMKVICELAKSGECEKSFCDHYEPHEPYGIYGCDSDLHLCVSAEYKVICVPVEDENE